MAAIFKMPVPLLKASKTCFSLRFELQLFLMKDNRYQYILSCRFSLAEHQISMSLDLPEKSPELSNFEEKCQPCLRPFPELLARICGLLLKSFRD